MNPDQWLVLTDYASKYRVSVSTLRRRIKNEQIRFKFQNGKYFVFDAPVGAIENGSLYHRNRSHPEARPETMSSVPSVANVEFRFPELSESGQMTHGGSHDPAPRTDPDTPKTNQPNASETSWPSAGEEPILSTDIRILNELKRAYMSVLHEKEEQIVQLKEEVSDLKTLVRVLEDDNERLRRVVGVASPR